MNCEKTEIDTIQDINIFKLNSVDVILFKAKMMIDADGCPRAYHPNDTGLDYLANAIGGDVLIRDDNDEYVIQNARDPAPGYYVSGTSLFDGSIRNQANPRRYVDSENIPYIALPLQLLNDHYKVGDFCFVVNTVNNLRSFAVFADCSNNKIGEGSISLANSLEINSNPRNGGISGNRIKYFVFPNSRIRRNYIPTLEEIVNCGSRLLNGFGGESLINCIQ